MEKFQEIIDFAIKREDETYEFYTTWSERVEPGMKKILLQFASEELNHKERLKEIKRGKIEKFSLKPEEIMDLKLADYLVDVEPGPNLSYQDALIVGMKIEKASFRLYKTLSEITSNKDLKALFLHLAQEEAKHKLWFETEYDEKILKQY